MRLLATSYVTVGDRLKRTFEASATQDEFERKAKEDPEEFWEEGNEALANLMVQMGLYSSALEKLEHGESDRDGRFRSDLTDSSRVVSVVREPEMHKTSDRMIRHEH